MTLTKIGPKHQVTIPKEVFQRLQLQAGDYPDVRVQGERITMEPRKLVPKERAWFYSPEWQRKELEADRAIARGEVSGPFSSAAELIRHLRRKRRPRARQ